MVEYGLIIGVVAVVLIASLFILRGDIADIFTGISDAMNPAAG
jgi:Flp pilus assembly pilin Flp